MRRRARVGEALATIRRCGGLSVVIVFVLAACSAESPSVLSPEGESAQRIDRLWWLMLWISLAVLAVVLGLMVAAIVRRGRRDVEVDRTTPSWGDPFIVIAGVAVPALILIAVFVVSLRDLDSITEQGDATLTIDVIGHVWWWEVRYPGEAVTANEIHIPTGETVRFRLTSDDVIHSFWVPELAPKIDMIDGRTNVLDVRTDVPGTYRGQCAEFCGLQHANMAFHVIAEPRDEFDAWLQNEAEPADSDTETTSGLDVFLSSTCVGCHTIRGTQATGTLGPDLTHLASRLTLAAGTIPNSREDLARWIEDPQSIKPGNVMPPTELSGADLDALLDYLETLD